MGRKIFSQNKFINPKLEIEWLLRSLLKCNKLDIYLRFEEPLDSKQLSVLRSWIKDGLKTMSLFNTLQVLVNFMGDNILLTLKFLSQGKKLKE